MQCLLKDKQKKKYPFEVYICILKTQPQKISAAVNCANTIATNKMWLFKLKLI